MRYHFIQEHRHQFSVQLQCRVLSVSVSGYYAWRARTLRHGSPIIGHPTVGSSAGGTGRRARENQLLLRRIERVFAEHRQRYGSPRVHRELREQGICCSRKRVARLMRQAGLRARGKRRFMVTTDSRHSCLITDNHLARFFDPEQIGGLNRVWAGDITYLWTREGWLYLSVLVDLYSRRVVGWALGETLEQHLTHRSLQQAVTLRQPEGKVLHHSDRGSQYATSDYQEELNRQGMVCSMSRKGNCWDNAPVESFFATLKRELVSEFNGCFANRAQARQVVGYYIESYYNSKRRHSSLGYLSPCEFEQRHQLH